MRQSEKMLLEKLDAGVNNYHADEMPAMPSPANALKAAKMGAAQFNLTLKLLYFTENGAGVYTSRTAAYILANHASLATKIPMYIFGNSDYAGGFRFANSQLPTSLGWTFGNPLAIGNDFPVCAFGELDATVLGQFQRGDLVLPYTAVDGGVNVLCVAIIRCSSVAYTKLLDSLNSDIFHIDNIRYVVNDATQLDQFENDIKVMSQSLFGKLKSDDVSPTAYKDPTQFQNGIIDVKVDKGIDKQVVLGTQVNYSSVSQQWSVFVRQVTKLAA